MAADLPIAEYFQLDFGWARYSIGAQMSGSVRVVARSAPQSAPSFTGLHARSPFAPLGFHPCCQVSASIHAMVWAGLRP